MADKLIMLRESLQIVNDSIGIAERLYKFIETVRGIDQTAFVKDLANTAYYAAKENYNVMVFNLALPTPASNPKPSGVVHYSSVEAYHTKFGIWVFSGEGQWTNLGKFGFHNWCGIGSGIKRYDTDGTPNSTGRVMKFDAR